MGHFVPESAVERFSVLELGFLRDDNLVLGNGEICLVLVHRLDGTNPTVVTDHHIHRLKGHLFAFFQFCSGILPFQFLPKFRTSLLKICLRDIEHPEHLHLRIYIVHLLFVIGELLVIIIFDFLLGLLMDAGKSRQHYGKRLLTLVYRYPRQFHTLLCLLFSRFVHPLYTVKGAETGNLVALVFAMEKQHQRIHPVVFTSRQVLRPPQTALGEPRLFPVLADGLDAVNHHFRKEVKSLVLCGRTVIVVFPVTGHDCQLLGLYGGFTYSDISDTLQAMFRLLL